MSHRIIGIPGLPIDGLPFLGTHERMGGADMLQVIAVQVRVQGRSGGLEALVVDRARQGRETEELQHVHGQLALDGLDIGQDALGSVIGEAEDVTAIGRDLLLLPGQEHRAVVGDFVLFLAGCLQTVRMDVFQADEDPRDPGAARLVDEAGQGVGQGVDLDGEGELDPQLFAYRDDAIEDRLPIAVTGEVVIGDEVLADAMSQIGAQQTLDVVRRTVTRLASLDIDDGAEATGEGTATPGVEGSGHRGIAAHDLGRQERQGLAVEFRQIGHVIVDRLQTALMGRAQQIREMVLGFAGEERDAQIQRLVQLGRPLGQHRQTAADMEATDGDLDTGGAEAACQVQGPWKLVGLNTHETDESMTDRLLVHLFFH